MKSYIKRYRYIELVKATLSIFGRSFWTLMGLIVLFLVPPLVALKVLENIRPTDYIISFLVLLAELALQALGATAAIGEISRVCQGERPSIGRALSGISIRIAWGLFYTGILAGAAIGFWIVVGLIPPYLVNEVVGSDIICLFVLILTILPCVYFIIKYTFIFQIVVLEEVYWNRALQRSTDLVSRSFRRVAGYTLPWFASVFAVLFMLGLAVKALLKEWLGWSGVELLSMGQLGDDLIGAFLTWPLLLIFTTLLYYDLKIREQASSSEAEPQPEISATVPGPGYGINQSPGS